MAKKAKKGKSLVIVESPAKARTIASFWAEASPSRPASATSATCRRAQGNSRRIQGQAVGQPGRQRRRRFRADLHRAGRQEATGHEAQGPAQRRRRPLSGDGRRPRRRGHQLALVRDAQAEGARPPAGVSRNHQGGDPRGPGHRRARSTTAWCGPRKRGASSTGCTATKFRRCCGARCGRSFRPAACKAWPCG